MHKGNFQGRFVEARMGWWLRELLKCWVFFTFSSLLGFLVNEQSDSVVNNLGQLRFFISWDIPEFVKL